MAVKQLAYTVGGILACVWLVRCLLSRHLSEKNDSREPEVIQSAFPLIRHAYGLFTLREKYYHQVRSQRRDLGVYSLDVLGSRQYVVNDPSLIVSVQRQALSFSFNSYGVRLATFICGVSNSMVDMMMRNLDIPGDTTNFAYHFFRDTHASLGSGSRLDQLLQISIPLLVESVDQLTERNETHRDVNSSMTKEIDLGSWTRHSIITAATSAVYGPSNNPFASSDVRAAYDTFEDNILLLILRLPKFLISRTSRAQHVLAEAMVKYLRLNQQESGSDYIQSRYKLGYKYGANSEDIARLDLGGIISLNSSTSPVAFWLLVNIVARPDLLQAIRAELAGSLVSGSSKFKPSADDRDGKQVVMIDASMLWQASPLLISTYKETLRRHALGSTVRLVLEDTWIGQHCSSPEVHTESNKKPRGQSYLLKKGGLVVMPSASIHADPEVWGPRATIFEPTRFLKQRGSTRNGSKINEEQSDAGEFKPPRGAFRAFGGGVSLCPGRHWATAQVLTLVSLMVLMHNLEVVHSGNSGATSTSSAYSDPMISNNTAEDKTFCIPPPVMSKMTTTVENPAHDVRVRVSRREEWRGERCMVDVKPNVRIPDIIRYGE